MQFNNRYIPLQTDLIWIVGIYPRELRSDRLHMQARHSIPGEETRHFILPAAPRVRGQKGADGLTYTRESVPHVMISQQNYSDPDSNTRFDAVPIPNDKIAQALIQHWRDSAYKPVAGDIEALPGIMVLPNGRDTPTEEELEQLDRQQQRYAMQFVRRGDTLAADGKSEKITDAMRMWAEWLGFGDRWGLYALSKVQSGAVISDAGAQKQLDAQAAEIAELKAMVASLATQGQRPITPPIKTKG